MGPHRAPPTPIFNLQPGLPPEIAPTLAGMSRHELDVLQLLLSSRRVASIARELSTSACTLRNHLRAVFRKLGTHSKAELLEWSRGSSPATTLPAIRQTKRV